MLLWIVEREKSRSGTETTALLEVLPLAVGVKLGLVGPLCCLSQCFPCRRQLLLCRDDVLLGAADLVHSSAVCLTRVS